MNKVVFIFICFLSLVNADVYQDFRENKLKSKLKTMPQENLATKWQKDQKMNKLLQKNSKKAKVNAAKDMAYKRLKSSDAKSFRKKEDAKINKKLKQKKVMMKKKYRK